MTESRESEPAGDLPGDGDRIARHPLWARLVLVAGILAAGFGGMMFLDSLRQDPPAREAPVAVATATAIVATRQDVQSLLTGYGTARPHRTTTFVPEVEGRVVEVHPLLEVGNVIPSGEVLLRIDPTDFELAKEQILAEIAQLEQELEQLGVEETQDARRVELARESLELARRDLERVGTLVQSGGAESQARLDQVRTQVTQREDQFVAIDRALRLYPSRRGILQARLSGARARLARTDADLRRTVISAPFDARILRKNVELHQRVAPGAEMLALADDSILEIPVSLDGFEASRWLEADRDPADRHWIGRFLAKPVQVEWTEDPTGRLHAGLLDRIERYDPSTRTFHVVVTIDSTAGGPNAPASFPLTDGMFCKVAIPGRIARGVIPVPRNSVDSGSAVLVSEGGRLRSRQVTIARYQQDVALVDGGLEDGAIVLTSRPPRILDGMQLDVSVMPASGVVEEEAAAPRPLATTDTAPGGQTP